MRCIPGDKIQIMGVKVGKIDAIEPAGDKMKVTFNYENKFKVPANATASILNPSLVASRTIQLSPPYTGGPVMEDDAVIPIDRTQVPVEYDELRDSHQPHPAGSGPDAGTAQGSVRRHHRVGRRRVRRQGRAAQQDAERPVRSALHAQRGPRRLLRRGQESGAVRQRALPERSAVRRAERRPRDVHQRVHQHRPRSGQRAAGPQPVCCPPPAASSTRTPRC